ncbi:MAG: hypothetical protein C5S38_06010 [Candidatus Methanophagaceae archaeon]|nr:MAG: hypothetical protein C5S38_06010 [Methanophagales archaeon]
MFPFVYSLVFLTFFIRVDITKFSNMKARKNKKHNSQKYYKNQKKTWKS